MLGDQGIRAHRGSAVALDQEVATTVEEREPGEQAFGVDARDQEGVGGRIDPEEGRSLRCDEARDYIRGRVDRGGRAEVAARTGREQHTALELLELPAISGTGPAVSGRVGPS